MSTTIEHVSPDELPEAWKKSLRLKPGQRVAVTIEPEKQQKAFDRAAIEAALARVDKLPVLDDRTADEIIGYDENGLPT
ncbi:MAG: hypothetical protein AAGC95_11255 [Pseudomonadota bacterium]